VDDRRAAAFRRDDDPLANEALRDPDVRKRLESLSAEVGGGSLADTAAFFKSEVETWRDVIKSANVKLEP